jgi:hypothetical protein
MTSPAQEHHPSPQLEELIAQLDACSRRASTLVEGLAPERLAARPAPESWSAAECIAHLTLTNRAFPPVLRAAYGEARREGRVGDGPYRADVVGWVLIWLLEPPPRLKVGAKPQFQPVDVGPVDRVLPDFLAMQEEMKACVREAAGLAIDRIKIVSPVDSRAKYTVWSGLRIVAAHERRHLWQAERARERV